MGIGLDELVKTAILQLRIVTTDTWLTSSNKHVYSLIDFQY